jgi:hypothetical protein
LRAIACPSAALHCSARLGDSLISNSPLYNANNMRLNIGNAAIKSRLVA